MSPHRWSDEKVYPFATHICFCLILFARSLVAAENEAPLLTIEGNLFERIELLSDESEPRSIIKSYYRLLPDAANQEITERQNELEKLLPNYEVAYLAADSAEMAEVRTIMDDKWAKIRLLHFQFFNTEVISILNKAYVAMFGNLLPENFSSEGEK